MLTLVFLTSVACVLLCMSLLVSYLECKSVRSKVVSIDKSRFDRRLQLLLKCIELTIYQVCLRIFLEPGLQGTANRSLSIELFCCGIILVRSGTPRKKLRQQKRSIEICVSSSRIFHRAIITQHKNFYYYLYACKTVYVVFIIIYSSIELTFGFDRNDLRSNGLAILTSIL